MSTGYHAPYFYQQFFDALGNPLSNGFLYTYENLSTIPKPIYTDFNLLYPCTNPLELNVAGVASEYFCTSGFYTFTLKDRFGTTVASRDYIEGSLGSNFQFDSADYVLSAATTTTLGGIKVGNGLAIDGSGVLSVISVSAELFSLSAYATLSGSNFSGPVTSPTFSANSISALSFETSSTKISDIASGIKIENKSGSYDVKVNFGPENSNQFIKTESGQMRIGGENAYASFDGSNFYITSGSLIIGDDPSTMGTKSLINNQQFTQNYRATFNSSAVVFDKFKSKTLSTDSNGQLVGYDIGGVAYNVGDIPKTLSTKLRAGTGCVLTTANDGSNGIVTSINFKGNAWVITKNVTASPYVITDSDSTLVNNTTNGIFTLPVPSALYDGRIVSVQGANLGGTATVNSLGTLVGESPIITNYSKKEFICVFDNANWIWICRN